MADLRRDRAKLKNVIKKAKEDSWKVFVRDNLREDLYGIVDKL